MAITTSSLKVLRRPLEPKLHAAVAMMNEPPWGSAALESHDQGVDAEARLEMLRHRPAHDLARGQVLDGGQVQKALIRWNVRDVGQPHGVGLLGHKCVSEQVGRHREVVAAVRGLGPASLPSL